MQTFLPYESFKESAKCLDNKRLGKQRSECKIIVKSILGFYSSGAWSNHPATLLWKDHLKALLWYSIIITREWRKRGFQDSTQQFFMDIYNESFLNKAVIYPKLIGNKEFHDSHKSNLLRKDSQFYGKYNWNVADDLPYVWNINQLKNHKKR